MCTKYSAYSLRAREARRVMLCDVWSQVCWGLCSKNIFAVFAKKKKNLNFFFFFSFFLIDWLTKNDRHWQTDREERSLHSFTREGRLFSFETSSSKSSKSSRVNTFRERTFYTRAKEARLNKVPSLFLSVVHRIKESLDETRRRLLKGAAFRSLAAKRSKREREKRIENVPVGVDGTNAERNAGENRARTEKRRGDDSVSGATYTAVVVV